MLISLHLFHLLLSRGWIAMLVLDKRSRTTTMTGLRRVLSVNNAWLLAKVTSRYTLDQVGILCLDYIINWFNSDVLGVAWMLPLTLRLNCKGMRA